MQFINAFADISIASLMPDEYSNARLFSSFGIKFKTGSLRLRSYSLSIETALRKKRVIRPVLRFSSLNINGKEILHVSKAADVLITVQKRMIGGTMADESNTINIDRNE